MTEQTWTGLEREVLAASEAQQVARRFLEAKYFGARVSFRTTQSIVREARQIYRMQGKITMRSLGLLDRFTVGKSAHTYDFEIEIDAERGQVLSYVLV